MNKTSIWARAVERAKTARGEALSSKIIPIEARKASAARNRQWRALKKEESSKARSASVSLRLQP